MSDACNVLLDGEKVLDVDAALHGGEGPNGEPNTKIVELSHFIVGACNRASETQATLALLERAANELQYTEERDDNNPLSVEIYKFLEGGIQ